MEKLIAAIACPSKAPCQQQATSAQYLKTVLHTRDQHWNAVLSKTLVGSFPCISSYAERAGSSDAGAAICNKNKKTGKLADPR
jgi:hypothetical protein